MLLFKKGDFYKYTLQNHSKQTQIWRAIYKELNVPDRIGFLAQFSGCEIISTKQELQAWKNRY